MLKRKAFHILALSGILALFFCLGINFARADENQRVVTCLGDSVTAGIPYEGTPNTYPAKLQSALDSEYGADQYRVVNRGVSGYRADQVLAALQSENWLGTDSPDAVLLMIGGNDLIQGQSISSTVSEVQQIVDYIWDHPNADESVPMIVVAAFIPNQLFGAGGSAYVNAYNEALEDSLDGADLWLTDNWDDFYDAGTGQARAELMADTAHPNVAGYEVMAENWHGAVNTVLFPPGDGDDGDGDGDDGDGDGGTLTTPEGLTISPKIIVGSGPGQIARLKAYSRHGYPLTTDIKNLFPAKYLGGVSVAAIDAMETGVKQEVVIFSQSAGGPQARIIGIKEKGDYVLKGQMFLFDKSKRDGLNVTVGDFDDDGFDDDLAACLTGKRAPVVRIFKNARGMDHWQKIGEFKAPFGAVGCNLGTFQYDNRADEILVAPHGGPAAPRVYIYTVGGTKKAEFAAYSSSMTNGLSVTGIDDRVYTTPNGGTAHVMVFDKRGTRKNFWWAFGKKTRGDFSTAAGDLDLDGKDEILVAPLISNGPQIVSFEPDGKPRTWPNFFAFGDKTLRNGVNVTVIDNWHGEN